MTIDIIMPCYYGNAIIRPCLEKIASQTIRDKITLIMINDSSPNTDCNYQDLIEEFSDRITIKYLQTNHRSGPGVVRQIGLDNATADWIWFQDDDDEIYNEHTLEYLLKIAETQKYEDIIAVSGQSLHINDFNDTVNIIPVHIAVQGSLLNRQLLNEYNIHFESKISFKEEDGAFINLCLLRLRNKKVLHYNDIVYIKKWATDHVSLSQEADAIQSILALLGSKACIASYLLSDYSEDIIDSNFSTIVDIVFFIPGLINSLINALSQFEKTISQSEYENILAYVQDYFTFMNLYNIDIIQFEFEFEEFQNNMKCIFDIDNFYGELSKDKIFDFINDPQPFLDILKTFVA